MALSLRLEGVICFFAVLRISFIVRSCIPNMKGWKTLIYVVTSGCVYNISKDMRYKLHFLHKYTQWPCPTFRTNYFYGFDALSPQIILFRENDDGFEDGEEDNNGIGTSQEKSDSGNDASNLQEPTDNLNSDNSGDTKQSQDCVLGCDRISHHGRDDLPNINPSIAVSSSINLLSTERYTQSRKLSISENDLTLPAMTPDRLCSPNTLSKYPLSPDEIEDSNHLLPLASLNRSKSTSPRAERRQGYTKLPSAYLVCDPIMQPKPPLAKSKSLGHRQTNTNQNRKHRKICEKNVQRRESVDIVLRHKKTSLGTLASSPLNSRGSSPVRPSKSSKKPDQSQSPYQKTSTMRRSSIQTQLKQLSVTGDQVKSRKGSLPSMLDHNRNTLLPPIDGKLAGIVKEYTSELEE